jgi:hypothetical protein
MWSWLRQTGWDPVWLVLVEILVRFWCYLSSPLLYIMFGLLRLVDAYNLDRQVYRQQLPTYSCLNDKSHCACIPTKSPYILIYLYLRHVYLYLYLCPYLYLYLYLYLISISISISQSIYLSTYLPIYLSICLSIYLSFTCLSI